MLSQVILRGSWGTGSRIAALHQCRRMCNPRYFASKTSWLTSVTNRLQYTQLERLAVDESLSPQQNQKPRLVKDAIFTKVDPTPLQSPKLLSVSSAVSECLDLDIDTLHDGKLVDLFSGDIDTIRRLIPHCTPYSHCYAGHQFGNFAGQLGDGRAICLGEYINDQQQRWEIQLKGAGLTPYSRFADGRAVLRSSIREYLMSEAMHYLGIPTTRAATLIGSEHHKVVRDEFYNGNARHEKAAVVCRLSPSFIRFGSFEICSEKGGPSYRYHRGDEDHDLSDHAKGLLQPLLDYVIEYSFPEIWNRRDEVSKQELYELWWTELVHRTAKLVAKWQCIGFVHGVLNTDNMSISGLTLDYGPFGMMDYFYDEFVPNFSDHHGRYSYRKQPEICRWNLDTFALELDNAALLDYEFTRKVVSPPNWTKIYEKYYREIMCRKFGLIAYDLEDENHLDSLDAVIALFFESLQETAGDFTNCFRALHTMSIGGNVEVEDDKLVEYLVKQCASPVQYDILRENRKNPQIVALQRSLPNIRKMEDILRSNPDMESLSGLTLKDIETVLLHFDTDRKQQECTRTVNEKMDNDRKKWREFVNLYRTVIDKQRGNGVNGKDLKEMNRKRVEVMNGNNPKYILRNYMLQNCINEAEAGDYSLIDVLLRVVLNPFVEQEDAQRLGFDRPAPEWSVTDCVSCSS